MSDKPSLYVVEKKEVVILVILFVLVTVLAFTMGVKYGESVGRKATAEETSASKEHLAGQGEHMGGSLSEAEHAEHDEHAAAPEHGEKAEAHGGHEAAEAHGEEAKSPEEHAKSSEKEHEKAEPAPKEGKKKSAADHNSDEFLLNALKESGVQAPEDKAGAAASKLPDSVKAPKAGSFVIQIGSFPTKKDAEQQMRLYRGHKLDASILAPIKDKQGEWYRVSIGSYSNRTDAEKDAKLYKAKGLIKSYFVRRLN